MSNIKSKTIMYDDRFKNWIKEIRKSENKNPQQIKKDITHENKYCREYLNFLLLNVC